MVFGSRMDAFSSHQGDWVVCVKVGNILAVLTASSLPTFVARVDGALKIAVQAADTAQVSPGSCHGWFSIGTG